MRNTLKLLFIYLLIGGGKAFAQVDTSFIYNPNTPYGALDIRIAKSSTRYYYLQEGKTFSFRESSPGVRTNTYRDMTSWDSSPYEQGNLREADGANDYFVMNYRLLKPVGYDPKYDKGYPIIIMMHGSGEHGNCWHSRCYHDTPEYSPIENDPPAPTNPDHELLNNDHSLLHGGQVYLDAVRLAGNRKPDDGSLPERAFPGFVLFPQNLNGWNNNSVQDAIRLLRLVIKKYNIDEDRVYINGLSQGGHGVFEAIKRAPWMFSAVIAMSAVDDGFITTAGVESTIANIPIWYFQGELDTTPYPAKTKGYITKFRNVGAVVRYTEYEGVGHTTWNLAYKEPDFFSWMLGKRKSEIHTFGGSRFICSGTSGLELRMPEGHFAYQWQRNGETISGNPGAILIASQSGKYRGRFSRSATVSEWNEWSDEFIIVKAESPKAEISQIGTLLLRDLNDNNIAYLEASSEADHYYWYKDGNLINFPGDQDDTLRLVKITSGDCADGSCAGNGGYTLVITGSTQCKSAPSDVKQIFFSDQGPVNMSAPTEFRASDPTASSMKLSWRDNSNNEGGFEIWRRQKLSSGYSPWTMAILTEANATAFTDGGLIPVAEYQYKIRAVGNTGRSDYSPKDDVLIATTTEDTEPPGPPQNLRFTRRDVDKGLLIWDAATDNAGISRYVVRYDGKEFTTAETSFLIEALTINRHYEFSVRAVDLRDNFSDVATVSVANYFYGLYYEHSPGSFPKFDSIDFSAPEYRGYLDRLTLARKTQDDYFYFRFKGYLYVNTSGTYQFRTTSDDGSRLDINGQRVVTNDGIHEMKTITGPTITLSQGPQKFQLDFFDYTKTDSLVVEYKGPDTGNSWRLIDDHSFRSSLVVSTESPIDASFDVDVFPNPAVQDDMHVQVRSVSAQPVVITLMDPIGRVLHSQTLTKNDIDADVRLIPGRLLARGLYILKAVQGERVITRRVIVQR